MFEHYTFSCVCLSIYLCILSQPCEEDFRTGAQQHRAKKKERIKSKIGKVKKLKSYVTEEAKSVVASSHLISSQSLNLGGCWGTTDDVATIPFHPSLSSAGLRESPLHSLMLSSHLFFCLPLLLVPFTVPCRIVFAMPEDLEMWPYHLSLRFFTMVRRSSCTPVEF